ncbi:MAG: four-carbon acid sugar kinase family protein [Negativicutes bacterium]|nr:four-carbon acid sugar kinase family protein [Negativicutes bacterium]
MIGVVADDTTGANDIGIMFRKGGYLVKVVTYFPAMKLDSDADVIIIDTDSRLDSAAESYRKVYNATKALAQLGCDLFHKKTCSVFRGNIGAEFDAMLDALGEEFAVVSLAFPKNGRQTKGGIHTVHGRLLEESEFRNDPVHPMRQSSLVDILQGQTKRKVCLAEIGTVRQGAAALRQAIDARRANCHYVIVDTVDQDDLRTVAEAVQGIRVLAGSSAIAEELPRFRPPVAFVDPLAGIDMHDANGVLVVSGSLMPQTRAQIGYLAQLGVYCLVFDSRVLYDNKAGDVHVHTEELITAAAKLVHQGQDVLVMADNDPAVVRETKELGRLLGHEELAVSKAVSARLAEIAAAVVARTGLKRLVVAGGDTSGTICRKLGIQGNYVLNEIETGIPAGLAIGADMLIVLKSGSFGREDSLAKAVAHLKGLV